jgi:hypothetical protein
MPPPGVPLFNGTCQLFTPNGTDGAYTVAGPTFACRLAHQRLAAGTAPLDRAELAASRRLIWEPGVVVPEDCEVAGPDGGRWRPVAGTLALFAHSAGISAYRVCEAVAAQRVSV